MMRVLARAGAVLCLGLLPAAAFAQASITGVVRDASGGALPAVTVEASSPVMIEKVRIAVTDGDGRYRIVDLRPGTYSLTFTLMGFSTVKRDSIQLTGSAATTVNADLKVGTLEETITVSGETPLVDTQNTTRQTVMDQEVISSLPTARNSFALGVLIPNVVVSTGGLAAQDVGGSLGPTTLALAANGSKTEDQRLTMNGVSLSTMIGGGWGGGAIPNASGVSEIAIDTSSVDASLATGGVRINFIPRDGGNRFSGTIAAAFANNSMQPEHIRHIATPTVPSADFTTSVIDRNYDFNPGGGGPIMRDRLWFFASGRIQQADFFVPGFFHNKNANNPNAFLFDPDTSRPAETLRNWTVLQARLTLQATPRNKIGLTVDNQTSCFCPDPQSIGATFSNVAPEAYFDRRFPLQRYIQADWNVPISSRLLLEASGIHRVERWGGMHLQESNSEPNIPGMISVTNSATGLVYRNAATFNNSWNNNLHYRAAFSYITGSHALKVGFNNAWGHHENTTYAQQDLSYTFNGATPTSITLRATPYTQQIDVDRDLGLYVQDKWTINRLTLSGGLRYDHFKQGYPDQELTSGTFVPNRNLTFPAQDSLSWHDITPKMGAIYDLFGNGKTALKASLNKYLRGYGTFAPGTPTSGNNPIGALSVMAVRAWSDNGNYIPDCNLFNPALQDNVATGGDLCGAFDASTFGLPIRTTTYDPDLLTGWGKRDYNWEFSTGVQHEVLPRMSVDVTYSRRWYGNFQVTDNRAVTAADFDFFDFTAPSDPRLPGGGGYAVNQIPNVSNTRFGLIDNFVTLSDNVGKQTEHWDGVGLSANARLREGMFVQGGIGVGRVVRDNCDVASVAPEVLFTNFGQTSFVTQRPGAGDWTPMSYCHHNEGFVTQAKAMASYRIPRVDVQIAGTFQSLPGQMLAANLTAQNSQIAPQLGRNLSGNQQVLTFNVLEGGELYGERLNQLDLRFAKVFRFAGTRAMVNFDIYNLFNVDTITNYTFAFGAWQRPLNLIQARFFKVGAQLDF
jgi:hypothetical protein